jgi:Ca2+-transporting ATPase
MGHSGTDVAKDAADIVLVDDDFSTIISAVEEGKTIFNNVSNFIRFQLSTSISALLLVALTTLFGYETPLNAMQILWISNFLFMKDIICDGPVAQSLGVESPDPEVIKRPPRSKEEQIISTQLIKLVLLSSLIVVAGTLTVFVMYHHSNISTEKTQTMVFQI